MLLSSKRLVELVLLVVMGVGLQQAQAYCPHPRFVQKHICDWCTTDTRAHHFSLAWLGLGLGSINTVITRMPQSWQAGWYYGGHRSTQQATGYTCVSDLCVKKVWECTVNGCQAIMSNVRCLIEHIEHNGHIVLDSLAACIFILPNDPLCGSRGRNSTGHGYGGGSTTWVMATTTTTSFITYSNVVPPWV